MRNVLKWAAIILGIIIVLVLVVSPFLLRAGFANIPMHAGFNGWGRMGAHPGLRMIGGFGMFGGMGLSLLRFLGQVVLLGLVVIGAVALLKYFRTPQTQTPQSSVLSPDPAPVQTQTCKACGKPLQSEWANCPYCGEKI